MIREKGRNNKRKNQRSKRKKKGISGKEQQILFANYITLVTELDTEFFTVGIKYFY